MGVDSRNTFAMPNHMLAMTFQKSSGEIKNAVETKVKAIELKVAERERRVARLREEYSIDDSAMVKIYQQRLADQGNMLRNYSYSSGSVNPTGQHVTEEKVVGAGVVENLVTEQEAIASEKGTVKRLGLLSRNLRPVEHWTADGKGNRFTTDAFILSYEELEFLGF